MGCPLREECTNYRPYLQHPARCAEVLLQARTLTVVLLSAAGPLMCVLWFGARLVVDGKLSPGELSAFVVYAIFVSGNVAALAGVFSSLIQARNLFGSFPPHS